MAFLISARFAKEGRSGEAIRGVRQYTLAEMIDTTRSRVNYLMNGFGKLGFIEYNGALQVHSSLLGVVLYEQLTSSLPYKIIFPGSKELGLGPHAGVFNFGHTGIPLSPRVEAPAGLCILHAIHMGQPLRGDHVL
jgi:hypothetical protein